MKMPQAQILLMTIRMMMESSMATRMLTLMVVLILEKLILASLIPTVMAFKTGLSSA